MWAGGGGSGGGGAAATSGGSGRDGYDYAQGRNHAVVVPVEAQLRQLLGVITGKGGSLPGGSGGGGGAKKKQKKTKKKKKARVKAKSEL